MKKYEFRSDIAISDCAFYAYGKNIEDLVKNACHAVTEAMVERKKVEEKEKIGFEIKAESLEELLYLIMDELIFLKDAKQFICHDIDIKKIEEEEKSVSVSMTFKGEKIDRNKHKTHSDVKAVTYHQFEIKKLPEGYQASVILDI